MEDIFVTGHRNPDMDSITSACAYSYLMSKVDKNNNYIPIRLGQLNESTSEYFKYLKINPPRFKMDAHIHIDKVYTPYTKYFDINDPIKKITEIFKNKKNKTSVVPIFNNNKYVSLLSVDEVSDWFLNENPEGMRPVYDFRFSNFEKVLKGRFVSRDQNTDEMKAAIMVAAMSLKRFEERLSNVKKEGVKVILLTNCIQEYFDIALKYGVDAFVFVGSKKEDISSLDRRRFTGNIFVSDTDTSETIRLMRLSCPIHHMMTKKYSKVYTHDLYDDIRKKIAETELRGFPVFTKDEKFVGYITRRNFIIKPKLNFALVDHNEIEQSIPGLDGDYIVSIIDHHRVDIPKTTNPISITAYPVGSTNTIIYELFKRYDVEITPLVAKIMLGGILSDTILLKSPTTTNQDNEAVNALLKIADVTIDELSSVIFSNIKSLCKMDTTKAILSDFKKYDQNGCRFGIGQVEVNSLTDITKDVFKNYIKRLDEISSSEALNWVMLLVTDIISNSSLLIVSKFRKNKELPWPEINKKICGDENRVFEVGSILSRKKQLLPAIIKVLE